ncbi:hypothetical protein [Dyella terrae]|uniref:hypothetical protein n=1 Tax=Dyella terrae TaxID=522259 RepID=UPI001EFCB20F|nr:hypothetical protein [Dyella terrae]ULU25745.1 hypothetical protein DYST_02681 [Dyella terrae]
MRYWFWALLVLSLTVGPTFGQTSKPKVTGVYSNLRYNQEGGDLLGMELLVIPSEAGYTAFVQIAEGSAPYTAIVPLAVENSQISFTLPLGGAYGGMKFDGELKATSLVIKSAAGANETLRRDKSYWQ